MPLARSHRVPRAGRATATRASSTAARSAISCSTLCLLKVTPLGRAWGGSSAARPFTLLEYLCAHNKYTDGRPISNPEFRCFAGKSSALEEERRLRMQARNEAEAAGPRAREGGPRTRPGGGQGRIVVGSKSSEGEYDDGEPEASSEREGAPRSGTRAGEARRG